MQYDLVNRYEFSKSIHYLYISPDAGDNSSLQMMVYLYQHAGIYAIEN
jgi:hypothetical protein